MRSLQRLVLLLALVVVTLEYTHGQGHTYRKQVVRKVPHRRIIVKKAHRTPYAKGTSVFRSPYDSYDEEDAFRTADEDVLKKAAHGDGPKVVVVKKPDFLPVETAHPAPKVHVTHVGHPAPEVHVPSTGHEVHVTPVPHVPHDPHHVVPALHVPQDVPHVVHETHQYHATPTPHVPHVVHDPHHVVPAPHVPQDVPHVVHETHHATPAPHVPHVVHDVPVYHYDKHVIPECAAANQYHYNLTVCLDDASYPTDVILHALKKDQLLTDTLMSDVTYQSADNLIDGLTKAEEEQYTNEHYFGVPHPTYQPPYTSYAYSETYYKDGGYICPSDVFYTRPKRAVNTYGEWKVIVNLPDEFKHSDQYKKYLQTVRLENCAHQGAPCSFIDHLYPSACLQKYNFVRLVAYDYERGLHVDSFKLPVACSCHLSPKPTYYSPY